MDGSVAGAVVGSVTHVIVETCLLSFEKGLQSVHTEQGPEDDAGEGNGWPLETIQGGFNFRGVGDFTFDGWASHLSVIISLVVWGAGEKR